MAGFFEKTAQEFGDIAFFKLGPQGCYILNHPDYIKDVLVTHNRNFTKSRGLERARIFLGEGLLTSEGDFHLRQRRLIQPAFHRKRIAAFGEVIVERTLRAIQAWKQGAEFDLAPEMSRLTLNIAGKTLFDAEVDSKADVIGQTLTDLMEMFPRILLPFSELLQHFPLPSNRRFEQAKDQLDHIVFSMIEERRKSDKDHDDLLSMLVHALDEEGDGTGMSNEQVRDEAITLLLAGHETTALALTWTFYLLSQNPDAERKLHQEVDDVLQGAPPTLEHVERLVYTKMVFSEAMRIYPPAWTVGRRARSAYEVGGYLVPAGDILFMSQYATHRDARFFPDPMRFDPMRFTPEEIGRRPQFAYFPFGGGPRVCIGEPFAWMEGVLVLATIAQQWRLQLVHGHPISVQPLLTLRPKYGMRMIAERKRLES